MQLTTFMKTLLLATNLAFVTAAPTPQSGGCWRDADGSPHCSNIPYCWDNAEGLHMCVVKRGEEDVAMAAMAKAHLERRGGCWADETGSHCDNTPYCYDNEDGETICVLKRDVEASTGANANCYRNEQGIDVCDGYCYVDYRGLNICVG